MSRLRDAMAAGEFVVTGEVAPPRGTDLTAMRDSVEVLGPVCDAINVTDNQGATLHLSSLAASRVVSEMGYDPIFQQTARDRNRLALQSDLLAAWTLGLENLLAVTGDDPRSGDHPEAKGVFDVDSTQMLQMASALNDGRDMMGRDLDGATGFYLGAAMFPEAEPWDIQARRIETKITSGAEFFQTQAFFDPDRLARATEAVRAQGAKVIAGVLVVRSARVVEFVNEKLAGLFIPDAIAERIRGATEATEAAIELAAEQVAQAAEIADGVHIMPLGLDGRVPEILERAGLR